MGDENGLQEEVIYEDENGSVTMVGKFDIEKIILRLLKSKYITG